MGRLWVVGEEAFVPNKIIIWTTACGLRELLIANPSSCASSSVSFHTLPSLISPYSSFLNAGLRSAQLLVPFLMPDIPLQLPAWHPHSLRFLLAEFCSATGVTPLALLLCEWFVEEKKTPYCKSLSWSTFQEDFLCCLLLIVMLCLNLSTNAEDTLCLSGYSPQWSLDSNSCFVWLRSVKSGISSLLNTKDGPSSYVALLGSYQRKNS